MLIVSQCGTGVFDMTHFVGAWIKHYGNNAFMLKALFRDKEIILGTFKTEIEAKSALNDMIKALKLEQKKCIYQI